MATFRAVVVGCGAMSRGWLRAIAENPDLAGRIAVVGLVDIEQVRAQALAEEFGLSRAQVGADLDRMLDALKPDIVFDVVVPPARSGVVTAALTSGAHVLSEKPMAASMEEARALLAVAAETGRVHAIIQNRRFHPGLQRVRRLLAEGTLGPLTGVHCDFFIGAHFGGFRDEMDHVLLLDMAIHTFDAIRALVGTKPRAVYCLETNPVGSWYAHGAAANAIFEFEGDVVATYRGSWCAEGLRTEWESSWRIIGTRGTLLWDGADRFEARIVAGAKGFLRETEPVAIPEFTDAAATQGHASVIRDFIGSLERGTAPETVATDNIASLAMVFGAISSAESGQRVTIEI